MGHHHHLLPVVVCTVAVVVLFLWLSSEHRTAQRALYSHLVDQGRRRLSVDSHGYLDYQQKKVHCDPTFKVISSLNNGVVTVDKTDVDCFGRCIEASKEYRGSNVLKPWEDIEDTVFTCEIVEVVCLTDDDPERVEHRMLHRQFLNVRDFTSEPTIPKEKNILVFFFDKMRNHEFLPKTVDYLEQTMSEVTGVGDKEDELRQIPLLYWIFTGLLSRKERRKELCTMFLGNETTGAEGIFQTATREGYVTMFNDDSFRGIFNTLGCPQGKEHLVDHSLEHFYTYIWNNWFMKYIFHGRGCQFIYRNTLDLIGNVWQTYPDRPIFSFNLISSISKKWMVPIFDQDLKTFLHGLPPTDTMIILANLSYGADREFRIFKKMKFTDEPTADIEEPNTVSIPETVERRLHPLKNQWTFWYLNDQRALSWEERLKEVCTFSTIEEFWALYNNIKPPSGLANTCDYNIFKKGIQPMWEVPENAKGGRWLINIEKGRSSQIMDLIWLEIILATIGEQFGKDMELICGLVCNIRNKGNKISIWTRDFTDDEGNMRIGNIIKNKLLTVELPRGQAAPIFDVLRYEDHDSCQKKSGSMVKARHQINAVEKMERD